MAKRNPKVGGFFAEVVETRTIMRFSWLTEFVGLKLHPWTKVVSDSFLPYRGESVQNSYCGPLLGEISSH